MSTGIAQVTGKAGIAFGDPLGPLERLHLSTGIAGPPERLHLSTGIAGPMALHCLERPGYWTSVIFPAPKHKRFCRSSSSQL